MPRGLPARLAVAALAVLTVLAGLAGCADATGAAAGALSPASARPAAATTPTVATRTTTQSIKVGGLTRTWVQIAPAGAATEPIIVVLSGISASAGAEMARDGLLGLPATGRAELVYPSGYANSWNAGGCCGWAAKRHVDDVAFLQALVAHVDPGHRRPLYLAGYSNGGRLAYRIACADPSLIDGIAVVKAMPMPGCVVTKPLAVLQIDSIDDYAVPYQPGDHGKEQPAATTEVSRLHAVDGCTAAPVVVTHGSLKLTDWSGCQDGTRLDFAVYTGGHHSWPAGDATTPAAATLIWAFVANTPPTHITP